MSFRAVREGGGVFASKARSGLTPLRSGSQLLGETGALGETDSRLSSLLWMRRDSVRAVEGAMLRKFYFE